MKSVDNADEVVNTISSVKKLPKIPDFYTLQEAVGSASSSAAHHAWDWPKYVLARHGRPLPLPPLIFVTSVALAVSIAFHFIEEGERVNLQMDKQSVTLLGAALFFILALRTNASYDRWWEARKLWGLTINRTRDLSSQALLWIDDPQLNACIIRHIVGFAYAKMHHLRFEKKITELVDDIVPEPVRLLPRELEALESADHMPLYALNVIRACLKEARRRGRLGEEHSSIGKALDENITCLQDTLGGCERILKTPFPFGYVVHLRTFIVAWLIGLPFVLVESFRWGTAPVTFCMAYALMGLEHLGVEIENPFAYDYNCLPLERLCSTIHTNLAEIATFQEPDYSIMPTPFRGSLNGDAPPPPSDLKMVSSSPPPSDVRVVVQGEQACLPGTPEIRS